MPAPTLDAARDVLRRYFGYGDFRPGQVDVVASVVAGADTLAVLPTGGGKSLCYQVPALTLSGLTVVISPLISLMKDQVDRLRSRGVTAAFLNSTLSLADSRQVLADATSGQLRMLYVAPERFESKELERVLQSCRLALLAVDEAHCISEWGHEFRPSFRRIADVCERIGRPPVVALTATATPRVRRDIEEQLRLRAPKVIVCGFDRDNLTYEVRHCANDVQRETSLVAMLRANGRPAIVYAPTRAAVNHVTSTLKRARLRAAGYHGGLGDKVRQGVQERFMAGDVDAMVATNAFGMGIDKPDVRFVIHYAMPGTLEAYYQEAGRAGRDGKRSHCALLYVPGDRATHEWFIRGTFPPAPSIRGAYETLRMLAAVGTPPADAAALAAHCRDQDRRDVAASIQFLLARRLVLEPSKNGDLWVRLLATPTRIRRELVGPEDAGAVRLLRRAWRTAGTALHDGVVLPASFLARSERRFIATLRERQFVDAGPVDGLRPADAGIPFEGLRIDWRAVAARRASELEKLDRMEGYALTRECRRSFVLAYFGERNSPARCGGCDNCLSA